ncbi:recombinase family protein [Streptomyces sp. NPDC004528]|uniref:recombinase family protein n=1 Tax=Streptomyces sp. NPDC004528 TaxID=3154550 RepID=UPI0033AE27C6
MKHAVRLKAIVYIRVSMKREEMYSPEQQLYACQQWARMNNVEIVDVVEDLDLSGRNFAKRKISNIIERVRSQEAQLVLVWKWSRFGRNILQSQVNLHELENAGGLLRAVTEDFDTSTAAGRFSRDQMLLIADFQSAMIGDVWKDTHSRRKRSGRTHHGRAQFGYQRCPDCQRNPENTRSYLPCHTCHGIPIQDSVRGPAMVEVYKRWTDGGEPMRSIAADMTKRGIRSIHGTEMTPTKWYQTMDTGFAAGLIRYRVEKASPVPAAKSRSSKPDTFDAWYEGKHQALIAMDLWERYKEKRALSVKDTLRESKAKYAYSGMVHCWRLDRSGQMCKATMTSATLKIDTKGWRCGRVSDGGGCAGVSVPTLKLETAVFSWLLEHASGEGAGKAAMLQAAAAQKATGDAQQVRAEIERIQKKRDALLEMLTERIVSKEDYERKNSEYLQQIESKEAQAAELEKRTVMNIVPPPEYFSGLIGIWPRMEQHERRAALKKVILRIEIHKTEGMARNKVVIVPRWAPEGDEGQAASASRVSKPVLSAVS